MPTKYARAIDPVTGDYLWDRARRSWASAETPELAIVRNVLATPLGAAGRDRTYGVLGVDNAALNAAAVWRFNVLAALKRWIDRGVLRDVEVVSEARPLPAGGAALVYRVTFRGRSGLPQSTPQRAVSAR